MKNDSRKNKILFVFGTRPEAIKMAPVVLKARLSGAFDVKVCVTGQHRQMLDQVLSLFEIVPDYDLNLMKPQQTLNDILGFVVSGLNKVFLSESFDCVLVHGDTTTTLGASLAAFHQKIPVAHIEAGLRTHNLKSPWPEEMNRRVTGVLADFHFAPTATSEANLHKEATPANRVFVTGNTVIDALFWVSEKIGKNPDLEKTLHDQFSFLDKSKKLILVTGHRRENFGAQFEDICQGLKKLSERDDVQIVYPVHLNPQVQAPVNKILSNQKNVFLIAPQDYVPFVYLMKESFLIITDSGGVQEEAPSLGKPVIVMRDNTERPEAVEAGTVLLAGANGTRIYAAAMDLLDNEKSYSRMSKAMNPYGDGQASERILEVLKKNL